ncbi:MAG: RNA polymerase sigma factor [Gemmatimonadota bacterium]|nr:RNA polymerase sigma factor [Gemmatimonadota bacterium]
MNDTRPREERTVSDALPPFSDSQSHRTKGSRATSGNDLVRPEAARPKREIDIGAFRRGEGFEAVLEVFGPLIHSVAHRYAVDADEEEDLYQEACIRIYSRCHTFRDGSLPVWIYLTADRCCRNFDRARKSRQAVAERFSTASQNGRPPTGETNPWKHVLRVETNLRIRQALARLSARQAHAFVLTQVEGYSTREAARIMETGVSTVRSNLRHARKKLREHLEEEE